MSSDVGEVTERLENELCYDYNYDLCSFSNLFVTSPTSQLNLQPFRRFAYVTAHSPTLPLLHLRHSLFSNPCFASATSQALHLIHLSSAHSPTFPSLHLRHNSFSNPLSISQFILHPFFRFSYVTSSSLNSPELCSLSNLSVTSPTSQLILKPFRCFTYVTVYSPTLVSLLLPHKLFTYITWRAAHDTEWT